MDRPSVWRLGVVAALESAMFTVTHADRVPAVGQVDVIVAIVDVPADEVPVVVKEVDGVAAVVALLTNPCSSGHADALRAGAHGVVGCDASSRLMAAVVAAAAAGRVVLSVDMARTLAATPSPPMVVLTESEASWLRELARGVTVSELAAAWSVSAGIMSRRLRELYVRMGVHGRTDAVAVAASAGVVACMGGGADQSAQ